jgi:hypothetical protein
MTLEELEQQEGGTIQESQVPMAKTRRLQRRHKGATAGTANSCVPSTPHMCCCCCTPDAQRPSLGGEGFVPFK